MSIYEHTDRDWDKQEEQNAKLDAAAELRELEEAVKRLAELDPLQYDLKRKEAADELGVRVETLDKEVKKARRDNDDATGTAFTIKEPDPWPEAVDGAELLEELAAQFRRFVILPDHGDTVAAIWTLHSYAFDLSHITPILVIESPDKGCGKTTLRDALAALVRAPLSADGISPAAIFRVIEKWRPTLLLDDFDSWGKDNEELRGVLNTGYRRGGFYVRCVGDDSEPRAFTTFAPKAINLIGRLHPTLHDRAIAITMRRKLRGETVDSIHDFDGGDLQRKCARWIDDNRERIKGIHPTIPEGLYNRAADNWRPLLALAEVAGSDWPSKCRAACLAAMAAEDANESLGTMLLEDMRAFFDKGEKIASADLAQRLAELEERPWADYRHGKPITSNQVSRLLKPYKIKPKQVWIAGSNVRGYEKGQFEDAFSRYLGDLTARTLEPRKDGAYSEFQNAREVSSLADGKPLKPKQDGASSTLAGKNADKRQVAEV